MKLLVTGGSGFIGSNFVNYWLSEYPNDHITNLDIMTYAANPITVKRHYDRFPSRYKHIKGDITDSPLVNHIVKDVDLIVHFAAESHVDRSVEEPGIFVKTNVLGTQVLLDAALRHNRKRFHHISTDEVYGTLELYGTDKFTEETPYSPRSPYSAAKAGSDHLVNAYYDTFGLPTTITNCSNNYGPYQFPEKVIPLFILRMRENNPVPVYAKGEAIRDYLHVLDHCKAIERVVFKGKPGETYCVGGDDEKNTVEVATAIAEKLNRSTDLIRFTKDRPGHDPRYSVDHSKITTQLGWKPEYTFSDGLQQTIDWYEENQEWWEPIWASAQEVAEKYLKNTL